MPASRLGRAFSLLELLVVILIMAILMAILIPNLFDAKVKAGDRVAQQRLRLAATTAKSIASDTDSFADADAAGLAAVEPDLEPVDADIPSTKARNSRTVSVSATDEVWIGAALGEKDGCWFLRMDLGEDAAGAAKPTLYGFVKGGDCTAAAAPAESSPAWNTHSEFPGRK